MLELTREIANVVTKNGGEAFLVGGAVRDALLGFASKDEDVLVTGVAWSVLEVALKNVGRVDAVGASFGGYSVYWLAGNHNKRFKTLIAHCGMFNMESWYGTTEELWFANFDTKGPYWNNPDNFDRFSPHHFVKNWDTPLMVIHCEKDFRVPIGEGMQAFQAAQIKDIKSRFLYFEDEGHWVTKPQNGLFWQREYFRWLKETL